MSKKGCQFFKEKIGVTPTLVTPLRNDVCVFLLDVKRNKWGDEIEV